MINVADGLNALGGYLLEQALSTCYIGTHRLHQHLERKQELRSNDGPIYVDIDPIATMQIEDRTENAQIVGLGVGLAQDLACLVGSIAYLSGSDSRLAATAAAVMGGKLALNTLAVGIDSLTL